ncbi:hypothetical protein AVEN_230227-1 [Araneus ventricosus]|uniref:Uncharacterized protein n=1 Tax=Araneus ventricosus TaxID=182803 RepID=A0A4Y2DV40_ARAVE|nr:hypothetical protein AVEN_230227-1 [Araneus ventricosus]
MPSSASPSQVPTYPRFIKTQHQWPSLQVPKPKARLLRPAYEGPRLHNKHGTLNADKGGSGGTKSDPFQLGVCAAQSKDGRPSAG